MTGSPVSASAEMGPQERALLVSPTWIGDTIMCWPAVQGLCAHHPNLHLTVLAKPAAAALWALHAAPREIWTLEPGWNGTLAAIQRLRQEHVDRAWVIPHSVRTALIPWAGRIPERVGTSGLFRSLLLTRTVPSLKAAGREHQQFESMDLLGGAPPLPAPWLRLPKTAREQATARLNRFPPETRWVAVMPGATRGPSKCWPAQRFGETARRLSADHPHVRILVCGGRDDAAACAVVAEAVGPAALNTAGQTSLAEWAALLSRCEMALANDSGGMHLAAAAGARVVAIFGRTDPMRTGPLGMGHVILQAPGVRDRDIPRQDTEATRRLEAITVDMVEAACRRVLSADPPGRAQ